MRLLHYIAAFLADNWAPFHERECALIAAAAMREAEKRRWMGWAELDQREVFIPAPRGGYVLVGGEIDVTTLQDSAPRYIGANGAIRESECRNCGAPVGPHEHRCGWCGSYPKTEAA